MEPVHIFYKELHADENNVFTANITEKNEVVYVKFKKSQEYGVTGLSVNQDVGDSLITLTNIAQILSLYHEIQNLRKEVIELNLDLKITNPEIKNVIVPFTKKSAIDCPPIKLPFANPSTNEKEVVEFYNYYLHLKKFGFEWEIPTLDFKYCVELSDDETKLIKKMTMSEIPRKRLFVNESRIWNLRENTADKPSSMNTPRISILFGYMWEDLHVESMLNLTGTSKNLASLDIIERNNFLRNYSRYSHKGISEDMFYSTRQANKVVLFHALSAQIILFTNRIWRVFVPKSYYDKKSQNFLQHVEYVGEYGLDNYQVGESPDLLSRKYYEYKRKSGSKVVSLQSTTMIGLSPKHITNQ